MIALKLQFLDHLYLMGLALESYQVLRFVAAVRAAAVSLLPYCIFKGVQSLLCIYRLEVIAVPITVKGRLGLVDNMPVLD